MCSKKSIASSMPDWTSEEDKIVLDLYSSAEQDIIQKALPRRSWDAIKMRGRKLGVKRDLWFRHVSNIKTYERPIISPRDLGYIASFLDTEGSIGVNIYKKRWTLHPQISLDNKCREALEFIADRVGFGNLRSGSHVKLYKLGFESYNSIIIFLETVMPALIVKRRQAQLMIDFCKSRLERLRKGERGYSEREVDIARKMSKYTKWKEDVWKKFL